MDNKPTASEFSGLAVTPIASLLPDIGSPGERYLHAVVILLWPFSSATKQFGLLLSEPDPRLRGGKGQIKAIFRDSAAEAVAKSSIGIGDTVYLSLQGAKWKSSSHADSGQLEYSQWDLIFSDRVLLEAQRNSIPLSIVNIKLSQHEGANEGLTELPVTPKKLSIGFSSPISTINQSWASPAFSRGSNTLFSSPLLDGQVEEDGYIPGKGRKRTRFSRPSSEWVFVDSAPSPTKDGDIWDDENLEAEINSPDQASGEQGIENRQPSPSLPSENFLPTKESIEVHETDAQNSVEIQRFQPAVNSESLVPEVSNHLSITQAIEHGTALQPAAENPATVMYKPPLPPDTLDTQTPLLHPTASSDTPALRKPGAVAETSGHNYMAPVDSADQEFPPDNEGASLQETVETHLSPEDHQNEAFDRNTEAELPHDASKREQQVPSDRPSDLLADSHLCTGHLDNSTSTDNRRSPENVTEDAIPHHENTELLSTYSDSSSIVSVEDKRGTTRPSQDGLGVYKSSRSPDNSSTPDAEHLESSPSPESYTQHPASSDGNVSSDVGNDNVSPAHPATEPNKQEIFVISDDESEALDSEGEGTAEVQASKSASSSVSSGRESSSRSATPSSEKSALNERVEDTTCKDVLESQIPSTTADTNSNQHSSFPTWEHDNGAVNHAVHPYMGDQEMSVSFSPIAAGIPPTTESDFSHHDLRNYLSGAMCHPRASHIPTELAISADHPGNLHGEELMSHFLSPQPTDFRTPENTHVSWAQLDPSLRIPHFPVQMDPNLPTPENSQSTEHIQLSIPGLDGQAGISNDSHSYVLPEHPSVPLPDPVQAGEARATQVQVQVTEVSDHRSGDGPEITHQIPSDDHISIEPASEPTMNLEISGLRTRLSYFCPLSRLVENFNQLIDCIAIVVDITSVSRAVKGAKDYHISLKLTDKSSGGSTTTAQIFHREKDALPAPAEGDAILLRNFRVQSLNHMMILNNMETSAWAFFPQGGEVDVQVDGTPVEFGTEEQDFATNLREWYRQEGAELVIRNASRNSHRESISVSVSSRSASETGSHLRNAIRKRRRESRITYHELRDGKRYADVGSPSDNETIHELRNGTLYAHPS
ncbi:TPA_exp: Uncharacterized protein A8136_6659 [Trichophyton benhamiae CBS 112371]|uniref:Telomeric single stranded DNA binding POT1/Cdc13 domain-containing protein n=1 Tax=Arthroderma benhamiae (strain ATCC MYA-4681 / CBS 112371) TaxID=663331 RepID=D4AR27_ARTBC|nr:uncharacterized protein ARB_06856 [Trichophyton benhamiae CBS 112371]EFE34456.1 conserved hypothetical protein [Trichophyton benhamiae CBS 112371]DAA77399.1 TPA_exp: Uncharacterized protein A8136_6659 [Trichophyton benhamiae CBS 112371]